MSGVNELQSARSAQDSKTRETGHDGRISSDAAPRVSNSVLTEDKLAARSDTGVQRRSPALRRLIWPILIFVLIAAGAVAGYGLLVRPLEVRTATVQQDVPVEVYGLGSVEARVLSKVGFEVPGTIQHLQADQGDRVGPNAALARLDARQQEARVQQAEAAITQAKAALAEAEAAVAKADVVLGQAQRTHDRKKELVRGRIVSDQAAEEAQAAVDIAEAERSQSVSRLGVARANLAQAEATLTRERTVLAQHTLQAPFPALIVKRHLEQGAPARAADPVFTLIDPDTVWIRIYVDEALSGRLEVGQPATVKLRSVPGRSFQGVIARIGIENDRIGEERMVEITCHDCPRDFHLGEQAEAVITTARLEKALLVPHAAFENPDAKSGFIWTIEDGRLQRRRVDFGHRTLDGRIEIPNGALPDGAAVVVERYPRLRAGRAAIAVPSGSST